MEKTFADGGKIAKFVKVFSLESFPLYGIFMVDLAVTKFFHPRKLLPTVTKEDCERMYRILKAFSDFLRKYPPYGIVIHTRMAWCCSCRYPLNSSHNYFHTIKFCLMTCISEHAMHWGEVVGRLRGSSEVKTQHTKFTMFNHVHRTIISRMTA